MTSFSVFMLENPQGNTTPVLYMWMCGYKLQNNKSLEGESTYQIPIQRKTTQTTEFSVSFARASQQGEGIKIQFRARGPQN